jgi:hypothetical protein
MGGTQPKEEHLGTELALTKEETTELAALEVVIEQGGRTFIEVGTALRTIRDSKLYRATHETFEAYLAGRWELARSTGYQMIEAADVSEAVSAVADIPNEAQARPLSKLLKAEERGEVEEGTVIDAYTEAVELAADRDVPISAVIIAEVVESKMPEKPEKKKKAKPGVNFKKVTRAMDSLAAFVKQASDLTLDNFVMSGGNPNEKWLGQLTEARDLLDTLISHADQARKGL